MDFGFHHKMTSCTNTPHSYLDNKTPDEVFSSVQRVKNEENYFADFHRFGSTVYVLDKRQHGNKKTPKWEPRTRLGVYLRQSGEHDSNVDYVLNTTAVHISPQYHKAYDDDFLL